MQEFDMSALIEWRKRNKDQVLTVHGVRLGYMGAFVRAATLAAQRIPAVNSAIDLESEELIFRDYVDISIAVSTPKGLVTPVLKNCECLGILEIEKEILRLATKVRPLQKGQRVYGLAQKLTFLFRHERVSSLWMTSKEATSPSATLVFLDQCLGPQLSITNNLPFLI